MGVADLAAVSETIDWARTLLALGADRLDARTVEETLGVVLKHQEDFVRARAGLDLDTLAGRPG